MLIVWVNISFGLRAHVKRSQTINTFFRIARTSSAVGAMHEQAVRACVLMGWTNDVKQTNKQ